uniref:Unannotated protein n=1 Tax=freshwater metagenome TaxID=449393 RepID=A0A6J5ZU66_9ZZZZ
MLTNLPRSRRQRPSARREAARGSQNEPKTIVPITANEPAEQPRAAVPAASARRRTSNVPPAGYATPGADKRFGNADPAGLLTELTRAALRLLPG